MSLITPLCAQETTGLGSRVSKYHRFLDSISIIQVGRNTEGTLCGPECEHVFHVL